MKKLLKILGIIISIIILIYLVSIPIMRSKMAIPESAFFTPTPFVKDSLKKKLAAYNDFYLAKDSLGAVLDKFTSNKNADSIKINGVKLKRNFKSFAPHSNSEYYIFEPPRTQKVGIFWIGNGFNIFKLVNNLSELSKRTNSKIYVLNYSQYGYSVGDASFKTQFPINQNFYNLIKEKQAVDFTAGHSLGTVFATKIAADNKVPNLFLLAPASNLDDLVSYFKGRTPLLFRPYLNASELEKSDVARLGKTSENIKSYYGKPVVHYKKGCPKH